MKRTIYRNRSNGQFSKKSSWKRSHGDKGKFKREIIFIEEKEERTHGDKGKFKREIIFIEEKEKRTQREIIDKFGSLKSLDDLNKLKELIVEELGEVEEEEEELEGALDYA